MNSSKVKTQNNSRKRIKNISTVMAMLLAMVTLFEASANKPVNTSREVSVMEANTIAEIEAFLMDKEEQGLEEIIMDELEAEEVESVKVFDNEGKLLASGNPATNDELRELANQADYLTSFGSKKYYRIAK
ncbi:hypothetical protein [Roseivirga sp.]|uniref:hypothetical protein n=1 Tax=Roseivirga sp. TaxID=1964215 RepID=UPI003B51A87A